MFYKPQYYAVVSGVGKSVYPLGAFDDALRQAGIGDYNLVKVSSILPSKCKLCEQVPMGKGEILFAAYSTITVSEGEKGETAVAVAIPDSNEDSGVIFETSLINSTNSAVELVDRMCVEAMNNRMKSIKTILRSSKTIVGEKNFYTAAISAVLMW